MNKLVVIVLVGTLLSTFGCATTQLERKRIAIKDCTKEFLEYEADVKDAGNVCMDIYRRPGSKRGE